MTRMPLVVLSSVVFVTIALAVFKIAVAYRQVQAIEVVREKGGTVYTDGSLLDRLTWNPPVMYVDLSGQRITAELAQSLLRLPKFEHLYLDEANLDDGTVRELCRLRGLKCLTLSDAVVVEDGVRRLQSAFPGCEIVFDPRPTNRE